MLNLFEMNANYNVFKNLFLFPFQFQQMQIDSFFICKSIDSCLEQLNLDDNYNLAIAAPRQQILNSHFFSSLDMFCLNRNEKITSYQPVLMIPKDNQLKSRIDEITRNAFEAGLLDKWKRESQRKKKQENSFFETEPGLRLSNVGAIFFVCGGGYIVAITAFVCETFIHYKVKQKGRFWFWTYLEHFVDGHRHYFRSLPERLMKSFQRKSINISKKTRTHIRNGAKFTNRAQVKTESRRRSIKY